MIENQKVVCNQEDCYTRFIVIKPAIDLPKEHMYYTCHLCIRENNRKKLSAVNRCAKEYDHFDEVQW